MDICERIKQLIEDQNMTIASFARKIGVGDQTVRGIVVQKRNKPGYDVILKIVQTFEWLNVEWLITGEGEMRKAEIKQQTCEKDTSNVNMGMFLEYLKEKDGKIEKLIEENISLKVALKENKGASKCDMVQVRHSSVSVMDRNVNL